MARVYQSRQMLDPAYIEIMNKRFDQQIDSNKEQGRKVLEAYNNLADSLVTRGGNILRSGADMADYFGRKSDVQSQFSQDELNNPYAQAAADKYIRSGDPSSLLSYRQLLSNEADKKALAKEREQTTKWHEQIRQDEAAKKESAETKSMADKAEIYIEMLADKVRKTGNVNDLTAAEKATARQYIRQLKDKKYDTTILEMKLTNLIGNTAQPAPGVVPTGEQTPAGDKGKTTEELEAEKKERADKVKDDAAALTEQAKTVNPRDKEAVDAFNKALEELKSRRDNEGLTAEIKLPDPIKYVTKPTLAGAREGYKKGRYTAKQMKSWGYKWNDDIGDWE